MGTPHIRALIFAWLNRDKSDQMTRFLVCCAVLHFFGLNPGLYVSLCHKIRLFGPSRTTSVLRLDLSTEIDPI